MLELKLIWYSVHRMAKNSFNRTMLELKLIWYSVHRMAKNSFNRTMLELKLSIGLKIFVIKPIL